MTTNARRVAHSDWVERVARAGLLTKAVLYATIGVLAARVAIPSGGGGTASQEGAIAALARAPLGTAILVFLAIGLAGYGLWRLTQVWLGSGEGGAKDVALRISFLLRGAFYLALCAATVRTLAGGGSNGGGGSQDALTAELLRLPFGVALVVLGGLAVIGVGAFEAHKGLTKRFTEDLQTARMSTHERRTVERLGVVGLVARAVVWVLVGVFLIVAAVTHDPQRAVGLDGALAQLTRTPAGPFLLGVVAIGLLAYAVLCVAQARYARVRQLE